MCVYIYNCGKCTVYICQISDTRFQIYIYIYIYIYILSPFLDWPKKGDEGLRQRVHRKLQNDIYAVKEIHDPTVGQPKKQIVEKVTY